MSETDKLARLIREIIYVLIILTAVNVADGWFGPWNWWERTDSTDAADKRSGLKLHTDSLTGCQYLSVSSGVTPRLDRSGRVMCGKSQ